MGGASHENARVTHDFAPGEAVRLRFYPFWTGLGLVMVGLVIYLSLIPIPQMKGMEFVFSDKVAHFTIYGAMTFWFGQIFRKTWSSIVAALGLAGMGIALEFLQGTTAYRSFELADMAANTVGAAAGLLLSWTRFGNFLFILERIFNGPARKQSVPPEK